MKPITSKKHMARVAELPCIACGYQPVHVHHIRKAPLTGAGLKASDWFAFPLCQKHHADLHSDIPAWEMAYGSQVSHVERTLDTLYGD